jgi:hypothetical protein
MILRKGDFNAYMLLMWLVVGLLCWFISRIVDCSGWLLGWVDEWMGWDMMDDTS